MAPFAAHSSAMRARSLGASTLTITKFWCGRTLLHCCRSCCGTWMNRLLTVPS
jgi:hypothetical protein